MTTLENRPNTALLVAGARHLTRDRPAGAGASRPVLAPAGAAIAGHTVRS